MFDIRCYQEQIKKYKRSYLLKRTGLSAYMVRMILSGKDDSIKLKVIKALDKFFITDKE